jgi:hypothetical protein
MSAKAPAASAPVPAAAPQVVLTPLKPALIAGLAHTVPVLVRVQAPDADLSAVPVRQPYHLSLVIDRSGSMSGQPLQEAVRCSRHIVDRLLPTDVASLVTFDVLLVASPAAALARLEWLLRRTVLGLLRLVSGVLLVLVYVMLSPVSALVGRRGYLRRRPEQASWFAHADWRVSTWKAKPSEAIVYGADASPRLFALLSRVRTGGGLYLVFLTLLVLLALTLNVAAGSAKLAPFIYTLF